jgi:hypothetical protein
MHRAQALLIALIPALSTGCAALQRDLGEPLPLDDISKIASGSHYSSVLDQFGPPSKISALPSGMVLEYEYVHLTERQWGLILPGEIGKWIKAVYANVDAYLEVMLFIVDADGLIRATEAEVWEADAGSGFSVSLIFSAGSLVDTYRYEGAAGRIHSWGMANTRGPFETLNLPQNLETGSNGIELTATPKIVGQHTLELESQ